MQISDLVGIFEQYRNASVANPPKNVQQDYAQAADTVPSSHLADAVSAVPVGRNASFCSDAQ